jgi:hypothetical protein
MPDGPWQELGIDFMGPLPTGEYLLVIVDYYSRFKEIEIFKEITAKKTIDRLEKIFCSRWGYPKSITLDNASQFTSKEFEEYCRQRNITLMHSPPYWPAANGLVERQNESFLKRLQISKILGSDWKKDLDNWLLTYNTTEHSTTGKTPTELMMGRTIRDKIPSIQDVERNEQDDEARDLDLLRKMEGAQKKDERRRAGENMIKVGDKVVAKNTFKNNKLTSNFNPEEFVVTERNGSEVTIKNANKVFTRNVSHLKRVYDMPEVPQPMDNSEEPVEEPASEINPQPVQIQDKSTEADSSATVKPVKPIKLLRKGEMWYCPPTSDG